MRNEDYDRQKLLYERFIQKSNLKDFDKMKKLSDINSNNYKITDKRNFKIKNLFHSYRYENPSYEIYNKIKHKKSNDYISNNENNDDINDLRKSYTPNELSNFKLDFKNIIYDPEYKNKCLKGNYKWGNMKFNMQKLNMAKRRGISFEDFKLNKIDKKLNKKNTMEINGKLIINKNTDEFNNRNITENNREYNKKSIIDTINKNNDFIKRKYSGKNNGKNCNKYQNDYNINCSENGIYELFI